jgi:hypothetical protein
MRAHAAWQVMPLVVRDFVASWYGTFIAGSEEVPELAERELLDIAAKVCAPWNQPHACSPTRSP